MYSKGARYCALWALKLALLALFEACTAYMLIYPGWILAWCETS